MTHRALAHIIRVAVLAAGSNGRAFAVHAYAPSPLTSGALPVSSTTAG